MQCDYIRRDVNEAISEDGGAFIQLVNKNTVGLKSSIDEARTALFVVGANSMIEGYFIGIMRSVFEGIKEDGHPRTVGDITFYPVCGGTFDLEKGWDPKVNDVRIKARLLNGITLDVTDWTFRDVTPGRVAFAIDTVSDGTVTGQVSTQANAELNGRNFPAKELLDVSWTCGAKSGTVAADKLTVNVARITIDKTAFASLTAEDNGKDIVLTVRGCYNKATKTAVLKYVAPPQPPAITGATGTGAGQKPKAVGDTLTIVGTNLAVPARGAVGITYDNGSGSAFASLGDVTVNAAKTQLTGTFATLTAETAQAYVSFVASDGSDVSNRYEIELDLSA